MKAVEKQTVVEITTRYGNMESLSLEHASIFEFGNLRDDNLRQKMPNSFNACQSQTNDSATSDD